MENLTTQPYEKLVIRLGELDQQADLTFYTEERVAQIKREMAHIVFELVQREIEIGLYNKGDIDEQ